MNLKIKSEGNGRACPHCYAKRCRRGFMMIEAVFSIFIVGTILITFMAVMASMYRTEFAKRDLIIATNLAQEGIEIVRNIRDNNWKASELGFKSPPFPGDGSCYLVAIGGNFNADTTMPGADCFDLILNFVNNTAGFVHYGTNSTGTATKFSRSVTVNTPLGQSDARLISVTVSWDNKSVTMSDTLFAWADPS